MRTVIERSRWLSCLLGGMLAVSLAAQPPGLPRPRVQEIRSSLTRWLDELVLVEGFVTQYVEASAQSTAYFYLKDDWGGLIKVRTSRGRPEVGKRYAIWGPVSQEPKTKDAFISEEGRLAPDEPPPPPPDNDEPPPDDEVKPGEGPGRMLEPIDWWRQPMFQAIASVLGVALLGIVVALVIALKRRRSRPSTADLTMAAAQPSEASPPPAQVIEGKTIKMHAPPPGTLKLLPGWLEVVAGDETVKEIRFYRPKGVERPETTFGRAAGRPYVHIQLKPMTVSSRQAKICFDGGSPKLINFAPNDSNPTRVNDRELAVEEGVLLQDGDRIEMGEVVFRFHAS